MRLYGGDIRFACLEVQNLAATQCSFKIFFITQLAIDSVKQQHYSF